MLAMVRRQATVYVDGKPVDVIHFSGDSNQTVLLVVGMMKDVELGHAGLGGTNHGNINAD
jgi:hypothetical protein